MKPLPDEVERRAKLAARFLERPATREVIRHLPSESFRWLEHDYPSEIARWNYHPEYEVHLIRHGTGSYIIGDQIGPFGPGQVALIGPGIPHDWMSDLQPDEVVHNRDVVLQFDDEWFDNCAITMPELNSVRGLLESSSRGIIFGGATASRAAAELELIGTATGARRISHVFAVLATFAEAPAEEKSFITREWFATPEQGDGKLAVEAGLSYIFDNLSSRIRMSDAARLAHMSEPTFSKYFKRASGLTFSAMVKKLRIANACRLLAQTDDPIASVSLGVGYSNLANFNRQFHAEVGMTPSGYRKMDARERPMGQTPSLDLGTRRPSVLESAARIPV
ncbi:MAG: AraC family transcriptional regulator [Burkholderiaceae bacterium]|nr:AraC family transcriptional regulator [Microbacteriaceae bacterium]